MSTIWNRTALYSLFTFFSLFSLASPLLAQIGTNNLSPKPSHFVLADQYLLERGKASLKTLLDATGEINPLPEPLATIKTKLDAVVGQPISLHLVKTSRFIITPYVGGEIVLSEPVVQALEKEPTALAWLLAREVTHIQQEHLVRAFRRRVVIDSTILAALQKRRFDSPLLQLAMEAVQGKYSAEEEATADLIGYLYTQKAGYEQRKVLEAPETVQKFVLGYSVGAENGKRLQEYAKAFRNGVLPEWMLQGRMTKDVKDERGTRPEFLAYRSTLMDVFTNRSPEMYQRRDRWRVGVEPKLDGYLSLFISNPRGEIKRVLPNEYDTKGEMRADTLLLMPSNLYVKGRNQAIHYDWDQSGDFYFCFVFTRTPFSNQTLQKKIVPEDLARIVLRELEATRVDIMDICAVRMSIKR
jgi:hypothetical protein